MGMDNTTRHLGCLLNLLAVTVLAHMGAVLQHTMERQFGYGVA